MSSFKRKLTSKQPNVLIGTRAPPSSPSTLVTSTGIPSLDDILGGGLPLSCSLLTLAPDVHSAFGELVQKYFIAQGLACGQRVYVIDDDANDLVKQCMWIPGGAKSVSSRLADDEDEEQPPLDDKIKIAWRYEQMKKFQTSVSSTTYVSLSRFDKHRLRSINGTSRSADNFCRTFDLTCRIPGSVIDDALVTKDLVGVGVSESLHAEDRPSISTIIIGKMSNILNLETEGIGYDSRPIRICIPSLGSPQWGDLRGPVLGHFR
jgi:elongator complex protein 4